MTDPISNPAPRRGARSDKEAVPTGNLEKKAFSPQQYLEQRDGLPYLPLKWRLAWLRADYPQARITTRLVSHQDGVAVFRAKVELPEGGAATGWGARSNPGDGDHSDHLDYLLAAENQALSRALEALGYGTEYAQDFDPPAEFQPIPLPEPGADSEEPDSIEVPLMQTSGPDEEEENQAEEIEAEPEPVSLPERLAYSAEAAPRGEIRALFEKRPAQEPRPPAATPVASGPASAPAPPAPVSLTNPVVEQRLKNVRDEALRLNIKQIYYEARKRHDYDEDRVDRRSVQLYGKPAYELDAEEAALYYERITNPPQRRG